ncbi:MAG: M23 family metallopeptidase [Ruminococcus sp.]|jgi:murein DD-endopeptidase MepM/ murein hydrolase activator NlpD|nr:M23 family metallopeptidase [Ruminococcus sp.]
MKKIDFTRLSGKGLAIAVFACLVAVGGAGVYSYSRVQNSIDNALENQNYNPPAENPIAQITTQAVTTADLTQAPGAPVGTEVSGVPAAAPAESAETTAPAAPGSPVIAAADALSGAAMVRPAAGDIQNGFSDGELVKSKTLNVWKTHDGIDISAQAGENVKAMTAGTVTDVYIDPSLGVTVVIDHGSNLVGYYSNLAADVPVTAGQGVSAGTVIGVAGSTADSEISEEPHIHFALKKNGVWIDPAALLSGSGS